MKKLLADLFAKKEKSRHAAAAKKPVRLPRLRDTHFRSIRARGHFPDEQAALKCMYLTVRSLDPTGKGRIRWSARRKPALNAFAITFADRWPSEGTQQ